MGAALTDNGAGLGGDLTVVSSPLCSSCQALYRLLAKAGLSCRTVDARLFSADRPPAKEALNLGLIDLESEMLLARDEHPDLPWLFASGRFVAAGEDAVCWVEARVEEMVP